jgi:putative transposase
MIKRKQYTTDLQEAEWRIVQSWFERVEAKDKRGRKRSHDLRELINALRYVLKNGCTWRDLPGDFPAWQSVYYHYRNWRKEGLWQKFNKHLRRKLRQHLGRNEEPSAGCADSQSVKAGCLHHNGVDGGKKTNGRKRHLLVDTLGFVLAVLVTPANMPERKGFSLLLHQHRHTLPRLHHVWLDRGYQGVDFINRMLCFFGIVLDIVLPKDNSKGFSLQARRWVVERTFAWLGNYRRLSKDYEHLPASSEALIYLASCDLLLKRLAHTNATSWRLR